MKLGGIGQGYIADKLNITSRKGCKSGLVNVSK